MYAPWSRALDDPLRRISETLPWVVGFHCRLRVSPAFVLSPDSGILKGFGFPESAAMAEPARAASREIVSFMLV